MVMMMVVMMILEELVAVCHSLVMESGWMGYVVAHRGVSEGVGMQSVGRVSGHGAMGLCL
jgi:hypothetical protein